MGEPERNHRHPSVLRGGAVKRALYVYALIIHPRAAAFAGMEDHAASAVRPRQVERGRDGAPPVHCGDGYDVGGERIHEIRGAVDRIDRPYEVRRWRILFGWILLAE